MKKDGEDQGIHITYDEYQKIFMMINKTMMDVEASTGEDNIL